MTFQRIDNGKGHWYKLDGAKADGVTTLLKKGLPPPLQFWSARVVAEHVADNLAGVAEMRNMGRDAIVDALRGVPWKQSNAAAVRGTRIHKLAERLIRGIEVDVPDDIAGHVQACVKFLDEWKVSPVLVEAPVANRRWRYAGTPDVVADVTAGDMAGRYVIDYKATKKGIFPDTAFQLAAYRWAEVYLEDRVEKPMADLGIIGGLGVWLRADDYDVHPLDTGEQTFKDFCHIAHVARVRQSMAGLKGAAVQLGAAS